jgi:hypothetical protein
MQQNVCDKYEQRILLLFLSGENENKNKKENQARMRKGQSMLYLFSGTVKINDLKVMPHRRLGIAEQSRDSYFPLTRC